MSKFHYKAYVFSLAMMSLGGVAFGQPSTRLRLTQIQDAPDTTSAYFIVAGQGDTIIYKADILSLDSSGRVFTLVVGTDTIKWEDTTGGSSDNVYTTNGSISEDRTINLENNAVNDFMILQDSSETSSGTFLVQFTDASWSHFIRSRWNKLGLWHFSKDYDLYMLDGIALDIERKTGATGTFTITDNAATATGIQYAADYSANYTNRSLIDKEYADGLTGAFSTTSNVTSNSPGTLGTDDFVFGSSSLNDGGNSAHDSRFFFDKSLSSFRAGIAGGTQWNTDSLGYASTAFGYEPIAAGDYGAVGGGAFNSAYSGTSYAVIGGGLSNSAQSDGTTTVGITISGGQQNIAKGQFATIPGGYDATAYNYGQYAWGGGNPISGVTAQTSTYVLGNSITGNAATDLFLDGGSSDLERLLIPSGTFWTGTVEVVAYVSSKGNGTVDANDYMHYRFSFAARNIGGTTTVTSQADFTSEEATVAGATFTVTADDTNDALKLTFDGDAAFGSTTVTQVAAVVNLIEITP